MKEVILWFGDEPEDLKSLLNQEGSIYIINSFKTCSQI